MSLSPLPFHKSGAPVDLESNLLRIIRGEKKAPFLMAGLAVMSSMYRCAVCLRNFAYDRGFFRSWKLSVPVISIGNITVGGTGKTPLVHLLVRTLQERLRLGVLTRGYRSGIERSGTIRQISSGEGPLFSAEECGDEPFLLAQKTKAQVWVGADRVESGRLAILEGVDCLILDDGMQHRRIRRDVEIVVVDGSEPFSRGRFLPFGLLRDSPKVLKRADLIVATQIGDPDSYQRVQAALASYSTAPVIGTQIEVVHREKFPPRKVGVFCGIGHPARFLQTVRDLKSEIVDTFILRDHATLKREELEKFAKNCIALGAVALLCTEKDAVKLLPDLSLPLDVIPVGIELRVLFGKEHWERLVENILDKVEK
jgi:tetraacyldisaccharide 4'-kinase